MAPPEDNAGPPKTLEEKRMQREADERRDLKKTFSISASMTPQLTGTRRDLENSMPDGAPRQYRAAAFDAPDVEIVPTDPRRVVQIPEFQPYRRITKVNFLGCLVFFTYLLALGFYMWVRITKTLDLGPYLSYGIIVLIVELLGSTTVILYGVNLLLEPVLTRYEMDPACPNKPKVKYPYHVRVLVPCYKESLDILRRTIMAAYDADLPEGCSRTIYLCDDGKDPKKRKWVDSLGSDVVYVSGRKRAAGEMNGKSGNLNNVCSQLYPKGSKVPPYEILCIFDADQVASKEFFLKTIPYFDGGDDVGMVLSPQCFHNLNMHSDIFNHSNVHFWEYMQPGYDALGFISCTGTNFLVRATAMLEVGGSPTWTLTEDFALGMELKKYGWHCRYVQEYLAIGEAPTEIRNCYQQRSRWCKGHFQIMFNRDHCPLFQKRLSWPMRILYCSGVWSYIVNSISTPLFILIPCITIWFGVFPIVVSWWMALGVTVYYFSTNAVLYYVRSVRHFEALWFANTSNAILWWTYVKAFWRAVNSVCGQKIQFKTTLKGATILMNSIFRDLWMPVACFVLLAVSIIFGLVRLFSGATISSPLAISIIWAIYAAIPHLLVITYALVSRGTLLKYVCWLSIVMSFGCGILAVALMWSLFPAQYDFAKVLNQSNFFYYAQRVGVIPDKTVPWRADALTYETGPGGTDLTGGWLQGGPAGNLKMTYPTAFTVSLLAWGILQFPEGYATAKATLAAANTVRWGADYLLKTVAATENGTQIVYQMGNYTTDQLYWGRPEDITMKRPFYAVPAGAGASDLNGAIAAALAAASLVWRGQDPAFAQQLMTKAYYLYSNGTRFRGRHSQLVKALPCTSQFALGTNPAVLPNCQPFDVQTKGSAMNLYNSTTYYDDLLWAAAWMYKATGDQNYLRDAEDFYVRHLYSEQGSEKLLYNWNSYYWAANVLLVNMTDGGTFHERAQHFLQMWICGSDQTVQFTPRGRAWNRFGGSLGETANAVFLAAAYSKYLRNGPSAGLAERYMCWARSQVRYMLGDAGFSFVVGQGSNPPTHAQNQAASCNASPTQCSAVSSQLSPNPNPNVLYGALVEGNGFSDNLPDLRTLNSSRVYIENNAGFQGALAAMVEAPGTWEQCLQGYGVLTQDHTVCSKL